MVDTVSLTQVWWPFISGLCLTSSTVASIPGFMASLTASFAGSTFDVALENTSNQKDTLVILTNIIII